MTIYLNGEYMPIAQAKVSVLDRGFIFGDGVYEVIPVYSHQAFRLEAHLLRLQHSLDSIQLLNPHRISEWTTRLFYLPTSGKRSRRTQGLIARPEVEEWPKI